jgi:hypothetical protein
MVHRAELKPSITAALFTQALIAAILGYFNRQIKNGASLP